MLLRGHDPGPGEDAHDDRRCAVQHVRDEAADPGEPAAGKFGAIDAGADAHRQPHQAGRAHDDERPHDGMDHATANLTGRHRELGEEVPGQAASTLEQQVQQDKEERQDGDDDRRHHKSDHRVAAGAAEPAAVHSALLPTPDPRATRQMRSRAPAFTTTVSTKSTKATYVSAEKCMTATASENSFAMAAAIVYPGANSEAAISCRLPMSIV